MMNAAWQQSNHRVTSGLALILLSLALNAARAAERVNWLTGPALKKKLQQRESVAWSGQPTREALESFSRAQKVALLLDRRIDPNQPMEMSLTDTPLAELLSAVAEGRSLGVSFFGPVIYVGPPATARRLRTVLELRKEELSQLSNAQRLAWLQAHPWRWDDFATPRDLLGELAKEGKFEIKGLANVPHDLWAAADLPPLSMPERLTLILAQFDYTYRLGPGSAIQIERIPDEVSVERNYSGGGKPQELAQKLTAAMPGTKVTVSEGKVIVRALVEQHDQIAAGAIKTAKSAAGEEPLERRTFTLTASNQPLKTILDRLETQLGLELKIDAAKLRQAGRSLDTPVDVKVKDASIDETLKAVLSPAGLKFRRTNKTVEIDPAE